MATPMQIPPATVDTLAVCPCFWCNGSGRIPNDDDQRYDDCDVCEGSGSRPSPLPRGPLPQLAEPIAA